jgi:DtxR family Mn-dependent transcriptional regulator
MPKLEVGHRRTSAAQEDYLKALFRISAGAETVVPNARLAEEMGVSPGSVSEMLGKLATLGLIVHDPYRGARLSPAGLKVAVEMIRHHRLIETYLVRALGYGWDEVYEEADRLEHSISELLEERMWQALGQPAFDPHGDPIPAPDGTLVEHPTLPLQSATAGSEVTVSRISDRDPAKLRAVERLGLKPGRRVLVVEESVWESPIVVSLDGSQISVPLGLARAIRIDAHVEGGSPPPT